MARTVPTARASKRRRLSQNFLTDPRVAAALVRLSGVTRGDLVLEIGPGRGIVTQALARKAGRTQAYELDPVLARRLAGRYADDPRVHCVHRDFLSTSPPSEPFSVVANIPYARTAAIVEWCLKARELESATLLTQLEYARKRTGDYGRWSLLTATTWPWFSWELHGQVPRHSFRPIPSVDSAILRITRRSEPLVRQQDSYIELVRTGYSGIGGTVRASLRTRYRGVDEALTATGIDHNTVVAYVHPDQWVDLHSMLTC